MRSKEDIENYIKGVPFYKSPTNFCLGNTMEEAGMITRLIMEDKLKRQKEKELKEQDALQSQSASADNPDTAD